MNLYIVDDDEAMVHILSKLIEQSDAGEVTGSANNGETALVEILYSEVDIVLVDLLMPKLDGVSLVKRVREAKPDTCFIMVSQITDSEMITSAYEAGIDFYINKPINKKELETVINKITEKLSIKRILGGIQSLFKSDIHPAEKKSTVERDIKRILGTIGMLGETGTKDIAQLASYLLNKNVAYSEKEFDKYCASVGEKSIVVRQRIRRAIRKGLAGMANLGISDINNEYFQNYVNILFDYGAIKAEMDFIKGVKSVGGKVNVDRFVEGLILHIEI